MALMPHNRTAARKLPARVQAETELDSELRAYVEMVTEERIAAGMPADEARRTALAEFGGMEQVKQAVRDKRAGAGLELIGRDLRFGFRQLVRNPGFTLTVVITLALAIGANTAIFSILNALLLKSLPYSHPERMGAIFARYVGATGVAEGQNDVYVHDARVSARYLDVLDIPLLLGRNFSHDEDLPHGPNAAILSYSLWRNSFGGDRSIVGRPILLKGESYTVIGVLPRGAITPVNADVFTPLQPSRTGEGMGSNFEPIVRLRDGANWQQADAELGHAWAAHIASFASRNPGSHVVFHLVPLQKGITATLRPQAIALMLAAGFILLIACANLAGLTLVRMARRAAEIATRLALGASAWQIQRQLWIENLLLACLGGAAGVGVGFAALRAFLSLLPEDFLPVQSVPLDARVFGFTLAVTLLTSALFGMLPALAVRKVDLRSSIASRTLASVEKLRLRQVLIGGEVALSVVLLAGAGLLIRT